jgi:PKD repeat protein
LDVHLGTDGATYVLGGGLVELGQPALTLLRYAPPALPNQAPTALAAVSSSAGTAPLTVQFSSAGSSDPEGQPLSHQWDFGDGTGSTEANPVHTYAAGSFNASLTVTDAGGLTSVAAPIAIQVNPAPVLPAQPETLALASPSVAGGSSTQARVTVSSGSGVQVRLASSNPKVASVPSNLKLPAGSTSASFVIKTSRVRVNTPVVISATANGKTVSATLTVLGN